MQLHVVHEILDYVQNMPSDVSVTEEEVVGEANAIFLSAAALGDNSAPAITTMKLKVQL